MISHSRLPKDDQSRSEPIYLDHQATTPLDQRVLEAMLPFLQERFSNAASGHAAGRHASAAVEEARDKVAQLLDCDAHGVIFTSGATEANNLAISGLFDAEHRRSELITVPTEHPSVLEPAAAWERSGHRVSVLSVDADGRVDLDELRSVVSDQTLLVSVMAANNEIGTLAPMTEIAEIAHEAGAVLHCDATQLAGKLPFSISSAELDLVSVSAHKMYGPKGVGALYFNRRVKDDLAPLILGGGQERGLRSGTVNVPGCVGFGEAAELSRKEMEVDADRLRALADRLYGGVARGVAGVRLNGPSAERLPGNLNLCFDGVSGEDLMMRMPTVAVATGSACSYASQRPSHVLLAIGRSYEQAESALRFGVGRFTTQDEVEEAVRIIVGAVEAARQDREAVAPSCA